MKPLFYTKTLIALAVAITAAAAAVSQAQEQPIPPPSVDSALPSNIAPGTPLADVVKMVQAGTDVSTIRNFIQNSQNLFNLDADKIVSLTDMGVPSELVNAMMDRDKMLYAAAVTPPPAPVAVASAPEMAPPPAEVTVNYFYNTLSPYGSWVEVDGYGRCWRPTVVVYDSSWRPYCDRGHWVYTDCGWYWDSDYAWGAAFHYGRWFHHARFGWCWYPDTVWAPSWVAWRSDNDYCGWAPLPPFSEFRAGFGFYYHGASVGFDFDFGLNADCFLFVRPDRFCDRHPRSYCLDRSRVTEVFHHTTIINNYVVNNRVIENRGIPVDHIRNVTHRQIEPIHVGSLPHADRQGWRGDGPGRSAGHSEADNHGNRDFGNRPSGNHEIGGGPGNRDAGSHDGGNRINGAARGATAPASDPASSVRIHRADVGNVVVSGGDNGHRGNSGTAGNPGNRVESPASSTRLLPPTTTGNAGQTVNRQERYSGNAAATQTHIQPSQPFSPATGGATVERRQPVNNNWQSSAGGQSQVAVHSSPPAVVHESSPVSSRATNPVNTERNNSPAGWQGRSAQPSAEASHGAEQLQQQHQFVPATQSRVETHVESARSYSPPPQSSSSSSSASSQSRGGNNDSNNSGSRGSDHNNSDNRRNR